MVRTCKNNENELKGWFVQPCKTWHHHRVDPNDTSIVPHLLPLQHVKTPHITRSSDRPGEATTGAGRNWWRYRQKSADFEDIGSTAIIHGFPGTFWFSIPSCPSFCGRFPRFLPLRCLARMAQVPTQLKMIAFGVLAIVTNFLHFFCELQNMFHFSESSLQQSAHLTLIGW